MMRKLDGVPMVKLVMQEYAACSQNDWKYCYGEGFVKVLMQDYGMLHGVIAFIRTHYHAWWRRDFNRSFAAWDLWVLTHWVVHQYGVRAKITNILPKQYISWMDYHFLLGFLSNARPRIYSILRHWLTYIVLQKNHTYLLGPWLS